MDDEKIEQIIDEVLANDKIEQSLDEMASAIVKTIIVEHGERMQNIIIKIIKKIASKLTND